LEVVYRTRMFRTLGQLIVEWVVGLASAFFLLMGLATIFSGGVLAMLLGGAGFYLLTRLRDVWSRKPVTIYSNGDVMIGGTVIRRDEVREVRVFGERVEPGLIIGQTVLSYEPVVEAGILTSGGAVHRLRLKSHDFAELMKYLKTEAGQGRP